MNLVKNRLQNKNLRKSALALSFMGASVFAYFLYYEKELNIMGLGLGVLMILTSIYFVLTSFSRVAIDPTSGKLDIIRSYIPFKREFIKVEVKELFMHSRPRNAQFNDGRMLYFVSLKIDGKLFMDLSQTKLYDPADFKHFGLDLMVFTNELEAQKELYHYSSQTGLEIWEGAESAKEEKSLISYMVI